MIRRLVPIILTAITALALLLPRHEAGAAGPIVVEALTAEQGVPGPPPPGFTCAQQWRQDLLDALIA